MKTLSIAFAGLFLTVLNLPAQVAGTSASADQFGSATPTPYQVVAEDGNSRVLERTDDGADGKTPQKHRYIELEAGMNHLVDGQWVPSSEKIDILSDGTAAATNGQHQAYFPGDIYQSAITVVTAGGEILQSRPFVLLYTDGKGVESIGNLKSSIGELTASNQVVYPDAFEGIKADIRYTYTKAGFEQDIILRQQPPSPISLGLDPAKTRIEVMTEFFDPPTPELNEGVVDAANKMKDTDIKLGDMRMILGKAFATSDAQQKVVEGTAVFKDWLVTQGRTFLVEKLPYQNIAQQLQTLPLHASITRPASPVKLASSFSLPPSRPVKSSTSPVLLAKSDYSQIPGVVLDYVLLNVVVTNFTFQADTTYLMNGSFFQIFGLATFEGGTVIKFGTNSGNFILQYPAVSCQSGQYRPVILTALDDNTVGETISGSTGNPTGYYGNGVTLYNSGNVTLHDIRLAYLNVGLNLSANYSTLNNIQAINCNIPIIHQYAGVTINNGLFYNIGNVAVQAQGSVSAVIGTHLTIDNCNIFADTNTTSLTLANSLVTATTNLLAGTGTLTTNKVTIVSTNSGIYQTVGAGSHYLANGSAYRGAGTNNIDAAIFASLSTRTTYPPLVYSNLTFSVSTNLQQQAIRDTNSSPDLGYHYDPLDYITDNLIVTNSTLTVSNGIAIACYNEPGILLRDGSTITSIGTPLLPNWFVRYQSVQDKSVFLGGTNVANGQNISAAPIGSSRPNGTFQFTHFATPANGGFDFNHSGSASFSTLTIQHSELWGGTNDFSGTTTATTASLMNNLFFRSGISASNSSASASLALTNNLIYGTVVSLIKPSAGTWSFFNNDVDSCTVNSNSVITNGYNAFINCSASFTGTSNLVSTNAIAYQTGTLGTFYQPTNSPLINIGNAAANQLALNYFTTQTNQVAESNSIVDIGYHYVALDTTGKPLDLNSNGISDYLEVTNQNQGPTITVQPANQTVALSSNATFSVTATGTATLKYQWWFNVTNALSGATNSTLTLNNVQTTNAGNYTVIVTNGFGAATSSVAVLTVLLPVSITAQPTNLTVVQGSNATFSVTVTGTSPNFQWYFNTTNLLAGATSSSLTLINVQATNAGNYSVVVSNAVNSVTSSNAVLTVSSVTYNFTLDFGGSPIAQAAGNDWNTVNNWNPFGLSASSSEASYPGSTYELKAGERLRTPAGSSLNTFPGNRLTVDGGGIFENATLNYVAELRLKCTTGQVATNYFAELVLSGGQLDNGGDSAPSGDLKVIQGRITVSSNSVIYVDSGAGYDRGFRIESWLTGSGNLLWHQYGGSLSGVNLQIACATNAFTGQWIVDQGVLLGGATNSLGTNNIIVGTNGLTAAVETLYDIHNTNGNLVVGANGKMFLHQNDVFGGVNLNGTSLAAGVYTFAQLNATNSAMFPASWSQQNGSSVSSGSGSITVIGTIPPPTITLTNPPNNSVFLAGTNILIGASVVGSSISQIQFFQGTTSLGTATSSPYIITWSNAPAGNYALTAVALNGSGLTATSQVVTVTVSSLFSTNTMKLWLKADAITGLTNNASIATWVDSSGSGNDATQGGVATNRPTYVTNVLNGLPIVNFNGWQTFNLPTILTGTNASEVYLVLKVPTNYITYNAALWNFSGGDWTVERYTAMDGSIYESFGSTTAKNFGALPQTLTQYHVYDVSASRTNWAAWINGQLAFQTTNNSVAYFAGGWILGLNYYGFTGGMAELLIFNRALTSSERLTVNTYLNSKYNLVATTPLGPTNLVATAIATNQISLTWSLVMTNSGATQIGIERATTSNGVYQAVAQVPATLSYVDTNLSAGTTYFYRVRAINLTQWSGYSGIASATTLTAGASLPIDSLVMWLKADAGLVQGTTNTPLSCWVDQSGNGNHASQPVATSQPNWIPGVVGGQPTIRFVGGQRIGLTSFLTGLTGVEALVVLKRTTSPPATDSALWYMGGNYLDERYVRTDGIIWENLGTSGDYYILGNPVQSLTQAHVYDVSAQGSTWAAWLNGQLLYLATTNTINFPDITHPPYLGGNWNDFNGDISEVMFFSRALTASERDTAGKYLFSKYGLLAYATNAISPGTPTNLLSTGLAPNQLNLKWGPLSTNAQSFHIERKLGAGGAYQEISAVAAYASNYLDTTAIATNQNYYRVKAHNLFGDSGYSTEISPPAVGLTNLPAVLFENVKNLVGGQATDADGTVTNVTFFAQGGVDKVLTGFRTATPYTNSWVPTLNGLYSLTALATDNQGNSQYSTAVSVAAYLDSNGDRIPDYLQVSQGLDPLNPWTPPSLDTNDHTAPIIMLLIPTNAVIVP